MWNMLWIFIDWGSASRMAMGLIFCLTLKGPYRFGESLWFPVIDKLRPLSQTWSPSLISVSFLLSLRLCMCCRSFWANCLASSRRRRRASAARVGDSRCFRITCGFIPIRSSCGVLRATLCFHELCHRLPPTYITHVLPFSYSIPDRFSFRLHNLPMEQSCVF